MEEDVPIEHGLDQPRDRERAEEGRGPQLRHPQEPARVRRRDEPAAQDDLCAAPAGARGPLRARADRRREEEGQDRGRHRGARRSRASTPSRASPRSVRPMLGRMCESLTEAPRAADPNAPDGRTTVTDRSAADRPAVGDLPPVRRLPRRRRRSSRTARARSTGSPTRSARRWSSSASGCSTCPRRCCRRDRSTSTARPNAHAEDWDLDALRAGAQGALRLRAPTSTSARSLEREALDEDRCGPRSRTVIEAREAEFSLPCLLYFARHFFLEEIDARWIEHLKAMEALREGIGLRGYGQKDPEAGVQEGRLHDLRRDDGHHRPQRLREAVPRAGRARRRHDGAAARSPSASPRAHGRVGRRRRRRAPPAATANRPRTKASRCAAISPKSAATIRAPAAAARSTRNATAP